METTEVDWSTTNFNSFCLSLKKIFTVGSEPILKYNLAQKKLARIQYGIKRFCDARKTKKRLWRSWRFFMPQDKANKEHLVLAQSTNELKKSVTKVKPEYCCTNKRYENTRVIDGEEFLRHFLRIETLIRDPYSGHGWSWAMCLFWTFTTIVIGSRGSVGVFDWKNISYARFQTVEEWFEVREYHSHSADGSKWADDRSIRRHPRRTSHTERSKAGEELMMIILFL